MTVDGLKEAVQLGAKGEVLTVTAAMQELLTSTLLAALKVQVWVPVGEKTVEPLPPERVPLPRFPSQLYEMIPSASLLDVHVRAEVWPVTTVDGLKEAVQVGNGILTVTPAAHVPATPALLATLRAQV